MPGHYFFTLKGFTLSLLCFVTPNIVGYGKNRLTQPIKPLPDAFHSLALIVGKFTGHLKKTVTKSL